MNAREIERALVAADPLGGRRRGELDRLDLEAMEVDLFADVDAAPSAVPGVEPPRARRRPPRLALAFGAAALAAAIAVVVLLAGGGSERSSRAYGAELIRFAESTPLLLLEGPGWRVQDVTEYKTREGTEGQMEFVTGRPIPYSTLRITGNDEEGQRVQGLPPLSVREREVELRWRASSEEGLADAIANRRGYLHAHGRRFVRLPVLDTTAFVDTRAEVFVNQGGPGDREMIALWAEGGNLLELQASVPGLAAFEERLDWVTKVDSQAWLEAMPAKVVKAADFEGTVRAMVKDIPLPKTFSIARVPDEGLTTNREGIGSKVAGTVSCLWLRQWGEARRTGDEAAALEAERAMATSRHWKVLTDVEATNGYSPLVWQIAAAMKKGYWEWHGHHRDLLAHAEGLGCARLGLPLVPEKMKRQRERGAPPPPD
ncbi:MAG TPA: hypothetical protein VHB53_12180 [Solirubrobacterales bacterium]|nr:hypothetical protein [Solirubrobacterales bacterium]